jgi:hypothetical protein
MVLAGQAYAATYRRMQQHTEHLASLGMARMQYTPSYVQHRAVLTGSSWHVITQAPPAVVTLRHADCC